MELIVEHLPEHPCFRGSRDHLISVYLLLPRCSSNAEGKLKVASCEVVASGGDSWLRIHSIPFYGMFHVEYENLLKKLVAFSPIKGSPLEEIIKDSRMNVGHEEELMPYTELLPDCKDPGQTQLMVSVGYLWEGIHDL
ncbi:serine/threonine-protein kinase MARK2-like [Kogia breviceps]|uniref:serine/threonine-protein kinase MARK2-like n=1 Tax=Kogia breviceps TaxID=27615 RepID=UPI0034D2BC58